ncbi:hypothetical protein ACA910_022193 [Epithemia clementina (nom. ined.)]
MSMTHGGFIRLARMVMSQQHGIRQCKHTLCRSMRQQLLASSSLLSSSSFFHSTAFLSASELPYHIVVGLPALSPTMDKGSLAEWYVAEGDSFSAGDVLAKIETDKATMDFEAQDDGSVAKILMKAGEGNDVAIGTPIMITVEEPEDVAAFKDYVHKVEDAAPVTSAAAAVPSKPKEKPAAAAAAAPPPAQAPAATPPPPPPSTSPAAPSAPAAVPPPASTPQFAVAWGLGASKRSPMAKTLAKEHTEYVEKYGTTGQRPLM